MTQRTSGKHPAVLSLIALGLLALAAVTVFIVGTRIYAATQIAEWPSFTTQYEETGAFYSSGDGPPESQTLKTELQYRRKNDWRTEIIEAPTIHSSSGDFSFFGSYTEVRNGQVTEYDSTGGGTRTYRLEDDVWFMPMGRFIPIPFAVMKRHFGHTLQEKPTSVTLCFKDVCEANARGWVFSDQGLEYVFADDTRGIPLGLPGVNITEVRVAGEQLPVPR